MIHGVVKFDNDLFYTRFKKHYCPYCNVLVERIKVSKVVNSKSPESSEFASLGEDGFAIGNIKYIWTAFRCPRCGKKFSVKEIRKIEKLYKDRKVDLVDHSFPFSLLFHPTR